MYQAVSTKTPRPYDGTLGENGNKQCPKYFLMSDVILKKTPPSKSLILGVNLGVLGANNSCTVCY